MGETPPIVQRRAVHMYMCSDLLDGLRTIGLSPMLYALWNRAQEATRNWELANMAEYDTCKTGSSALFAAVIRNVEAEIAHWLDMYVGGIFNDFVKFFDSMNINILLEEAIRTEYPPVEMCMAIQQHMAPRTIQIHQFVSKPIQIWNSIIAGCKQSIPMTRVYFLRGMPEVNKSGCRPKLQDIDNKNIVEEVEAKIDEQVGKSRLYVDDCAQSATDPIESRFYNKLGNSFMKFNKLRIKLKLGLSNKGVICCSDYMVAKRLQKELRSNYGVEYQVARSCRDIGVSYTAGKSRPTTELIKKFDGAWSRNRKIAGLSKINRGARKLFSASGFSASVWGHPACGLSVSMMIQLERRAANSTGVRAEGRCRHMTLTACYGYRGHPKARIFRETFKIFFQVLQFFQKAGDFPLLSRAWEKAKNAIGTSADIRGHLSTVLYYLKVLGWQSLAVNVWVDNGGRRWTLDDDSTSPETLIVAAIDRLNDIDALEASNHYGGEGMQNGVDYTNTFAWLNSKNIDYVDKCGLETILAAGICPNTRVCQWHNDVSPSCSRCGHFSDDLLHFCWTCPANADIEDVAILDTQDLIPTAKCKFGVETCLWTRGIIPANLSLEPLKWECNKPKQDVSFQSTLASSHPWCGTMYGDASGGKFSAYRDLRRVGCGLIMLSSDSNALMAAINFNLPGEVQTIPRGELYAIVIGVTLAPENSSIDFVTDNQGNYDKYNKGRDFAVLTANGDLFRQIFIAIQLKNIRLTVRWMPSHRKDSDELPIGVSKRDVVGNNFADVEAGKAAVLHEVDLNASTNLLHYRYLAGRIQRRIVAILQSLPKRTNIEKPLRIPFRPADLEALLPHSQHVLYFSGDYVCCARCRASYKKQSCHVRRWMISDCLNIGDNNDRPRPVPPDFLNIGNKSIHHSHSLNIFKGLIYCRNCGCRAQAGRRNSIRKLAISCQPPTDYGKLSITALRQGKPPPNLGGWPCNKEGFHLLHKTVLEPCSEFAEQLIKDRPSLSPSEAAAVSRAMLQCAEQLANQDCNVGKPESTLITMKDISAPVKQGEINPPAQPTMLNMFDQPLGCIPFGAIPDFGEPNDAPYTGGFNLVALHQVVELQAHTTQDMSKLIVDNAQFLGEAMDDQDRQWYTHLNNVDEVSVDCDMHTSNLAVCVEDQADFAEHAARNRQLSRSTHEQPVNTTTTSSSSIGPIISVTAQSQFAEHSAQGRQLSRMTSEQALEYYMNQHNA